MNQKTVIKFENQLNSSLFVFVRDWILFIALLFGKIELTDVKRVETRRKLKFCDAEGTWFGRELHGNKTTEIRDEKKTKEINDLEPKSTTISMRIEFNHSNDYNEQKRCIKKRKLLILLPTIIIITHHKRFKSFSSEKWLSSAFNFRLLVHVSWYENKS